MSERLLVFERVTDDGSAERTYLVRDDEGVVLETGGAGARLPPGAVEAVMRRYGRPLDDSVALSGAAMPLGDGRRIVHLRYRPRYDVIAKDYLVLELPSEAPLAELSTSVVAALTHLARAAQR